MAVVIPYAKQTHTVSGPWTAAKANVMEDGINDAHYLPNVRAGRAASQTFTTSTWTLATWTNELYDTAGNAASTMHDNSTNPARLIARHAGKFAWTVVHNWTGNATGFRHCRVQKNSESLPATGNTGVTQGGYAWAGTSTFGDQYMTASGTADMAVNDYLACVVWQNSGGDLTVGTDSYFAMWRIG